MRRTIPHPSHLKGRRAAALLPLLASINWLFCRVWHRLQVEGEEHIPIRGGAIVASNHVSSADPFLLSAPSPRLMVFPMAREYYELPLCRWFFRFLDAIPVERDGRDFASTRKTLQALRSGGLVCIFPEGRIRLAGAPGDGKLGVALFALRTGVPVIPARISGTPPTDSILWGLLTPSRARVRFGPPVDLAEFRGLPAEREVLQGATERIMEAIAALAKGEEAAPKPVGR
ncbi:MAG: lysophospholipid acyltransferase family protein [Nitrospinota bacterium]